MKEPQFVRDRFNIYWKEVSSGQIYCESEKRFLIQKYQQTIAGKAALDAVPVKGTAAKFFNTKNNL